VKEKVFQLFSIVNDRMPAESLEFIRDLGDLSITSEIPVIIIGEWDDDEDARLKYFFTLVDPAGNATDDGLTTVRQT